VRAAGNLQKECCFTKNLSHLKIIGFCPLVGICPLHLEIDYILCVFTLRMEISILMADKYLMI